METLKGVVTAVKYSTEALGEYGQNLMHVVTFLVDGDRQVRMRATSRPTVNDGDSIVVTGQTAPDVGLEAFAYRNISSNVRGNTGLMTYLVHAVVFPTLAWWGAKDVDSDSFATFLLLFAGGVSLWCLFCAARIAVAEMALSKAATHL